MSIKKIFYFIFKHNPKRGELMEIVEIRGIRYCATQIVYDSNPISCTIKYEKINDVKSKSLIKVRTSDKKFINIKN